MRWRLPKEILPDTNYGWFLGILKPKNYEELDKVGSDYTEWMRNYGLEKLWFNDGRVWHCGYRDKHPEELGDRLLCWSEIPDLTDDIERFYNPL